MTESTGFMGSSPRSLLSAIDDLSKHRRALFLSIFVGALLVRMVAVHRFQTPPVNDLLWNDAVAWNLAEGNGFTASQSEPRVPGIYRTPGYPAFVAVIYLIFGHSYYAAYVGNALLDAATAVLIGLICLQIVSPGLSFITAALYALYPYPAMFCPVLHQDILLTFSAMLVILLLMRAIKKQSGLRWFCVGLAVGAAALVKANYVLFVLIPLLTLPFHVKPFRRIVLYASALAFGVLLFIGPWMVRNVLSFHSFPPLAAGASGTNLMYVAQEVTEGDVPLLRQVQTNPTREIKAGQEFLDGAALIAHEKELTQRALRKLGNAWPRYLLVILKHIPLLWISRYALWHGPLVRIAGLTISFLLLVPGLAGMILLRSRWRPLLPLYLTIFIVTFSYAFYTAEARYTMPARPAMLVFAAAAILTFAGQKRLVHDRWGEGS